MIRLILGGARSGKSRHAEKQINASIAKASDAGQIKKAIYIATAEALDSEMLERIAHHKAGRSEQTIDWQTIESPRNLAQTLQKHANEDSIILVDCLSLWLTNELLADTSGWCLARAELFACLTKLPCEVIFVSNEVGMGIVPLGQINRQFVDELGRLNQDIAAIAQQVVLVTAGIAQVLKDEPLEKVLDAVRPLGCY